MIAVNQIAKSLYEQILSLHEFVDPHISKQFYLNRLQYFTQLPLLLEDMLFMFTNVSSKVRELVLTIKPRRLYTLDKTSQQLNLPQQSFPTQVHTQSDIKKKLTINSLGFGENTVLRERSINTKPVRKMKQSVETIKEYKENRASRQLRELKELRESTEVMDVREQMMWNRIAAIDKDKHARHSVTQNNEKDNKCEQSRQKRDPYGDEQIYMQNIQLNTLRDKRKDPSRKRKILAISIKGQNSPNIFLG